MMAANDDTGDGEGTVPPGLEIPTDTDGPAFDAPWQARIFGTVVALHRDQGEDFEWSSFQERLIEEVNASDASQQSSELGEIYYSQWLSAAEQLLIERGILDPAEIEERATEFAAGERNAQEFIEGQHQEDHGHSHEHEHDH